MAAKYVFLTAWASWNSHRPSVLSRCPLRPITYGADEEWARGFFFTGFVLHLLPCPSGSWLRWRSREPGCDSGQCRRAAVLVQLNVRRPLATQVSVLRLISPMPNAAPAVD
ncbi:unnamed protein product [Arctogadus glacialis]